MYLIRNFFLLLTLAHNCYTIVLEYTDFEVVRGSSLLEVRLWILLTSNLYNNYFLSTNNTLLLKKNIGRISVARGYQRAGRISMEQKVFRPRVRAASSSWVCNESCTRECEVRFFFFSSIACYATCRILVCSRYLSHMKS